MFTGIIEDIGTITEIVIDGTNKTFIVESNISNELSVDQSVSHDGVCLTIEECDNKSHRVTLIKESLDRSVFGSYAVGDEVNLERCIRLSDRLDGHMVQGHIDASVRCLSKVDKDGSWVFKFELPQSFKSLIVMKGSICLHGISLTVSALHDDSFEVSIIPYTYDHTNLRNISTGDYIHVEFDILGKYVQRHLTFV